jgi:hypothetical protein
MRQYHRREDWFRCQTCGHIFWRPTGSVSVTTLSTVHGCYHGRDVA